MCIVANTILLLIVASGIVCFASKESTYFKVGWSNSLILISVPINTRVRYILANVSIASVKIVSVVIGEIAHPIIGFNIYNPDKKHIKEFTKHELQIYGNIMYLVEGFKSVIMVMVSITQIDIALISMLVGEITTIFTIRMLLNEKTFGDTKSKSIELDTLL